MVVKKLKKKKKAAKKTITINASIICTGEDGKAWMEIKDAKGNRLGTMWSNRGTMHLYMRVLHVTKPLQKMIVDVLT